MWGSGLWLCQTVNAVIHVPYPLDEAPRRRVFVTTLIMLWWLCTFWLSWPLWVYLLPVVAVIVCFYVFRLPGPSATDVRAERFRNLLNGHRGSRHCVAPNGQVILENTMWAFTHGANNGMPV